MTAEGLKRILANSEGIEIEYKKSQAGLARSVYESICAFLNRRGSHVVLGADDDTQNDSHPDSLQMIFNHLTQRQISILSLIQGDSHVTVSMIAAKLKVSVATIHREFKKINAHIQVSWTGLSVGGHWEIG